jgi:uncharacterized protein (TIGR03437 family)
MLVDSDKECGLGQSPGPVSGTGDGVVRYAAAANSSLQTRRANITIAGRIFELVQPPANCSVSVASTPIAMPAAGGLARITISANCQWQATASASWIQFTSAASGNSDATLTFLVQPNTGASSRTANIVINGQTVAVTQQSQTCTLTLAPSTLTVPPSGGTSVANVTANTSCDWTAASSETWMEVTWAHANGSGNVTINAKPNTSGVERSGIVMVSGNPITVRQLSIVLNSNGFANAATFTAGAVAPGEIVTVFGSRIGPPNLVQFKPATPQPFPTTLGNTRLLFDGVPAPMIYTSENQLSAIVPYAVADRTLTRVQVEHLGALSNMVALPVVAASPGIFTLDMSGVGSGAILNQDFTLNTVDSPAARGSVIQIFATGEGQTRPAGVDGKLAAPPLPVPVLPVTVAIGGRPATVTYAGGAPGLVAGLVQINARVPDDVAPAPAVPVVIRVGEFFSREGVTLSVR